MSYTRLGVAQRGLGDLQSALKSYSASLAIIEPLAKSNPCNSNWQRDLSVSFGNLAKAHKQSGDHAKACDYFLQGHAIMARLTILSPDNAQWKKDLAWFDGQIKELTP
jgi:tetratricopeptide (TPR) repeat protein